jgi:hypothetical protein
VAADKDFDRRVPMRKALRLMAVLAAFGLTAWIGVVALAQGSSAPTPSTSTTTSPAPTPSTSTTTSPAPTVGVDVKGNCDEAEHANDPECVGANPVAEDDQSNDDQGDVNDDHGGDVNDDDQGDVNDDHGGDVNDDDQGENEGDDDQGENENDDDHGDDDQGDNSGPGSSNSGPGSSNSGPGSSTSGSGN